MNLTLKRPTTMLGILPLILIVLTCITWLFSVNAQSCLDRDFMTQTSPAICWRKVNDYENVISYSQTVSYALFALAIICTSAAISRRMITRSHATAIEHRKTALFLAALSILLLTFIITLAEVWQRTTYNNNNYALNTTASVVGNIGIPLWFIITSVAVTYGFYAYKYRKK